MTDRNLGTAKVLVLLPSLRISGGVKEAIGLARDLGRAGHAVELIVLWKSKHEVSSFGLPVHYLSSFLAKRSLAAAAQFPLLLIRFFLFIQKSQTSSTGRISLVLTHFSTFPLAWMKPTLDWYCFNQDVEWKFVQAGPRRVFLRWFILATSRRSRVITTNSYVEELYRQEGIQSLGRLSIWAQDFWLTSRSESTRDVDVVMLVRRGNMKRLDLYFEILDSIRGEGMTYCVVTPDPDLFEEISSLGTNALLRPSNEELGTLYRRAKVFLLLSDTEGFALPPLEAMGSGCVPLCRDSGGPRCYMTGRLKENLISSDVPITEIFSTLKTLLFDLDRLHTLSEYAREVFLTGANVSGTERRKCIEVLAKLV